MRVISGELHEKIVRMLMVVDWFTVAEFAGGQEIRITALSYGQGLGAHHGSELKGSSRYRPVKHTHDPVHAPKLLVTAITALSDVLKKRIPVEH
jgi:hypothetical protein